MNMRKSLLAAGTTILGLMAVAAPASALPIAKIVPAASIDAGVIVPVHYRRYYGGGYGYRRYGYGGYGYPVVRRRYYGGYGGGYGYPVVRRYYGGPYYGGGYGYGYGGGYGFGGPSIGFSFGGF